MLRRIHNTMRKLCPVYGSHSEDDAHQAAELNQQLFTETYFEEKGISRNKGKTKFQMTKHKKLSIGED